MSEEVKKEEEKKTVNVQFRIDITLDEFGDRTCYVIVSGVPEDLPEELKPTVKYAAESQFVESLSTRRFVECFELGKSKKDGLPKCINVERLKWFSITNVEEVK